MGKKSIEVVGDKAGKIVNMLRRAYADEMLAFHFYWYVAQHIEGLGLLTLAEEFRRDAMEELKHAEKLGLRIRQLGGTPVNNPSEWGSVSNVGYTDPQRFLDLKSAVEEALRAERIAIGVYNEIAKESQHADFVTFNLSCEILEDEVRHEQNYEDILSKLELR